MHFIIPYEVSTLEIQAPRHALGPVRFLRSMVIVAYHRDVTLGNTRVKVSVIGFESAAICDGEAPALEREQEVAERACAGIRVSGMVTMTIFSEVT